MHRYTGKMVYMHQKYPLYLCLFYVQRQPFIINSQISINRTIISVQKTTKAFPLLKINMYVCNIIKKK